MKTADFYVKETPNRTILLESVEIPGRYVSLWSNKYKLRIKEFSIYLLVSFKCLSVSNIVLVLGCLKQE